MADSSQGASNMENSSTTKMSDNVVHRRSRTVEGEKRPSLVYDSAATIAPHKQSGASPVRTHTSIAKEEIRQSVNPSIIEAPSTSVAKPEDELNKGQHHITPDDVASSMHIINIPVKVESCDIHTGLTAETPSKENTNQLSKLKDGIILSSVDLIGANNIKCADQDTARSQSPHDVTSSKICILPTNNSETYAIDQDTTSHNSDFDVVQQSNEGNSDIPQIQITPEKCNGHTETPDSKTLTFSAIEGMAKTNEENSILAGGTKDLLSSATKDVIANSTKDSDGSSSKDSVGTSTKDLGGTNMKDSGGTSMSDSDGTSIKDSGATTSHIKDTGGISDKSSMKTIMNKDSTCSSDMDLKSARDRTPEASISATFASTSSSKGLRHKSAFLKLRQDFSFFNYLPDELAETDTSRVEFRTQVKNRGELRHAMSEVLPTEVQSRRRSQTMANMKEHAYGRLQEELSKAQEELKLKDEEVEKLTKVRDQMGEELEELTASLFEEANNMVQEANIKRMHSEKLLKEGNQQIEVLQAEVVALKQLVLTSTPSSPNKHLHPQIMTENGKKEKPKSTKPFWKTHRRSTSHHEFTKEARQEVEFQQEVKTDRCKEVDPVTYEEFSQWRLQPSMNKNTPFLERIYVEDIGPCLNFSNVALAERLKGCVADNTLTIEPIPSDQVYQSKCRLTDCLKMCNYKIKLGDDQEWYSISQLCRNRIAAVCDFYTYLRYIHQGLVKGEDSDLFYEITRLRKQISLSRLGYS